MMVAAIQITNIKVCTSVAAGVDTPPVFEPAEHNLDFVGMQASIFRSASASRNQSASDPLSPRSALALGKASIISVAPPKSLF
jgi:hypothetical protein